MPEMAMFPLGTVLLPEMVLPLHVFEPRYRALAKHVVHGSGAGEFGVALIERGSEVGGDDARSDVGVVARVVQAEEFDDGRWGIVAVGAERIHIDGWLDDDPYPRAMVTPWVDEDEGDRDHAAEVLALGATMVEILDLAARLGHDGPRDGLDIDDDPVTATWQLIGQSPLGPSDRQRLLGCATHAERVRLGRELLADQRDLYVALVAQADDDT